MALKNWKKVRDGLYETVVDGRTYRAQKVLAGGTAAWELLNAEGKRVNYAGTLLHARMLAKHDKPQEPAPKERPPYLRVVK